MDVISGLDSNPQITTVAKAENKTCPTSLDRPIDTLQKEAKPYAAHIYGHRIRFIPLHYGRGCTATGKY